MTRLHKIRAQSTYYRYSLRLVTRCLGGLQWPEAIAVVVLMQGPLPSFAQGIAEGCVPPEPPYNALPQADLQGFRVEPFSDFKSYFSDITHCTQCLDAERARVMAEGAALCENFL
ncbi:hypothetical protein [Tabrizicola oligotrophica]|uniref:Uncharacterized protein n=1 Tax=Tabrizicola oligotrophica TaxID=2710650 RepID=A0A6M0QXB3_9RHOB|nr:hypothetical protein [Tabrizicola oligotrophica]NEY92027.1 hypothetical protein [Tabrizicola oligotrophica]